MPPDNEDLSGAELARKMRADRSKKIMLYNLCLFGAIMIFGGSYVVYIVFVRHGSLSLGQPSVDTSTPADERPAPPQVDAPSPLPDSDSQPSKYPTRKFAFICDVSPAIHPRINKFLPVALSSFGRKQNVDVMVLSGGDQFVSVTKGSIPMSVDAQTDAWRAVHVANDDTPSSFISALKTAEDEQVEAVYLLTSADQIKQLGDDPVAMFKRLTHGRKVQLNCVIFPTDADAKIDLDQWKQLADGTRGAYLLQAK